MINRGVFIVLCLVLPAAASPRLDPGVQDRTLELGRSQSGELSAGETHSYTIPVVANQYLSLRVEQLGIDVVATLVGPDNVTRTDANSAKGTRGSETLTIIADTSGEYRL